MEVERVGHNVVIAAHNLNPTISSQLWLVKQKIATEDAFLPGCVFTDPVVNVQAKDFTLLVLPEQFQFAPRVSRELERDLVIEKVGAFVRALPHTPYRAVGLNFLWHVQPK